MNNRKSVLYIILLLLFFCFSGIIYAESLSEMPGEIFIEQTEQTEEQTDQDEQTTQEKHVDPETSSLVINKTLISGVWHVGCDVMGKSSWVKDEISNPEGIRSREGHRLAYCGDPSHWIIYLDENGCPVWMDEIKSGATGGTLSTKFYTDGTYSEEKDISTVQIGERIYWTTAHAGQVWHHTGITTPEVPEFSFLINGVEYPLKAGQSVTISGLPAGTYEITEKYDPNYFVAQVSVPFVLDEDSNVTATVTVGEDDLAEVDFVNQRIVPDKPPEETEVTTEKPTQKVTEEPTEEPTQSLTQEPTEAPTEGLTQKVTQAMEPLATQKPTEKPTEAVTEKVTEKPTEVQKVSETETEKPTEPKKDHEILTGSFTPDPPSQQTPSKNQQTIPDRKPKPQKLPKVVPEEEKQTEAVIRTTPSSTVQETNAPKSPVTGDTTPLYRFFWMAVIAILSAVFLAYCFRQEK